MNNTRFLIMLIIALVLAGGAAWIAKNWVDSINIQKEDRSMVAIVAAAVDIPYGAKIEASQIKMLGWPKEHLPKGVFTDTNLVIGKIAQRAFVMDEVLLEPQIKDKAVGSILSALIPEGKRAMSVPVSAVSGVAGFITPGNMVDIIATNSKGKTYILLSNVKVLAIDQLASPEQDKPAVVASLTLELTVQESTILVKAMQSGSFYFTLRNPHDKQNTSDISANDTETVTDLDAKEKNKSVIIQPGKPRTTVIDWPVSGVGQRQETAEGVK